MPRHRSPTYSSHDSLLDARPDAVLDLHGFTAEQARAAVKACVQRAKPGAVLHIITGKGKGSSGGPVLRSMVSGMLKGDLKVRVADWSLDHTDGGYRVKLR